MFGYGSIYYDILVSFAFQRLLLTGYFPRWLYLRQKLAKICEMQSTYLTVLRFYRCANSKPRLILDSFIIGRKLHRMYPSESALVLMMCSQNAIGLHLKYIIIDRKDGAPNEGTLERLMQGRKPKNLTGLIKMPQFHEAEGGFSNIYVGSWRGSKVIMSIRVL